MLSLEYTAGGGLTLDGADYYWFFTKLMIGTALLFIPFALIYRPKTYLHEDEQNAGPFTIWVLNVKRA
jgi:POT family proton-dependent oligopeptide transporter